MQVFISGCTCGFRLRVLGFGFRVLGSEFRVLGSGFRVLGFGSELSDLRPCPDDICEKLTLAQHGLFSAP